MITKVILFHKLTGRIPLKREMNGVYKTARQFFGTWNNMIKAAGLHPNPIRFAERQIAKDGHSCDSIAEKLIDDWLSSHNITHSRNTPYPNTKYTADFFVDGKFVEFFGLAGELNAYDETIKRKEKIAEANSMKLIKIYPRDLFPSARLEGLLKNLHEI
ncbi:MAG: hypothetical protein HYT50_00100 [Candidatus Wildermuthbacteria bacterium]|nr:hypothetical protein [Candidatus Wildermuthbacteria bacterium]